MKFLNLASLYIATYYKDKYLIEDISKDVDNEHFAVDRREFLNIENSKMCVLGIIQK